MNLAAINFGADWRVSSTKNDGEILLKNLTAPLDQPETIRIAITLKGNYYSDGRIDPLVRSLVKTGLTILVQRNSVLKVSSTETPAVYELIPQQQHIVIRTLKHPAITADTVLADVQRTIACLFETNSNTSARLASLLHECSEPADL